MKKLIVNIILITVFIFLASAVISAFLAEASFNKAQAMDTSYRWKNAGKKYQLAIKANPFDSHYLAEYGRFLANRSIYNKDKIYWLNEARNLYSRAQKINLEFAEYYLRLGQIQIGIFRNRPYEATLNKTEIDEAFGNFRKALKYDPNGFDAAYSIGYSGMTIWSFLNDYEKKLVVDKLRYAISLCFWYCDIIFPAMWKNTANFKTLRLITPNNLKCHERLYYFILENNLWQFYSEQIQTLNFYRKKANPEISKREQAIIARCIKQKKEVSNVILFREWLGMTMDGKTTYRDGNMYWTGTIYGAINVPTGEATLSIEVRGTPTYDIWPYMIARLDGIKIGETFVRDTKLKKYDFKIKTKGGTKILSITFANNDGNIERNEDRNLFIGYTKVTKNAE